MKPKKPERSLNLVLYIIPHSIASDAASYNLERIIKASEVVNAKVETRDITLEGNMQYLIEDEIVSAPTLVRKSPEPVINIVGDLSDHYRTALLLEIKSGAHDPQALKENWNSIAESHIQTLNSNLLTKKSRLNVEIVDKLVNAINYILENPEPLGEERKARLEDALTQLRSLQKTPKPTTETSV